MNHLDNKSKNIELAPTGFVDIFVNTVGVFIICCLMYKGMRALFDPTADMMFAKNDRKNFLQEPL